MGVAIRNGCGAFILAGVGFGFPDGLFQSGNAGFLLGIHDYIVVPGSAAILGSGVVITGDGGHGQRDEEGIGGGSDHFGNLGFHQQIQTYGQILGRGLTDFIGGVHGRAAVADEGFQGVLHGGGICFQTLGQGLIQRVGGVEVAVSIQAVRLDAAVGTAFQTDGFQQICGIRLVEAVEDLGRTLVLKGHNVRGFQISEFHTGNGIAFAGLPVSQSVAVLALDIALSVCVYQGVFHIAFLPAGGGERIFVPHAVLLGVGVVELPDSQAASGILVDGFGFVRKDSGDAGQKQNEGHKGANNFLHGFHSKVLSEYKIFRFEGEKIRGVSPIGGLLLLLTEQPKICGAQR